VPLTIKFWHPYFSGEKIVFWDKSQKERKQNSD